MPDATICTCMAQLHAYAILEYDSMQMFTVQFVYIYVCVRVGQKHVHGCGRISPLLTLFGAITFYETNEPGTTGMECTCL